MTEPPRWSRSDSEVDPVLRATLRYARDFAPSNVEMQSLLRHLDDNAAAPRGLDDSPVAARRLDEAPRDLDDNPVAARRLDEAPRGLDDNPVAARRLDEAPRRRRPLPSNARNKLGKLSLAAVVTFGFGGMAWAAAYVTDWVSAGARNTTMEAQRTEQPSALARVGDASARDVPPSWPSEELPPLSFGSNVTSHSPNRTEPKMAASEGSSKTTEPKASVATSRTTEPPMAAAEAASRQNAMVASKDVGTSPEDDATLLQQARAAMVGTPERALSLLQTHAKRFPRSELTEERSELQIEALHRLGRLDEAKRARSLFESRFPNSPYRRRLRALMD